MSGACLSRIMRVLVLTGFMAMSGFCHAGENDAIQSSITSIKQMKDGQVVIVYELIWTKDRGFNFANLIDRVNFRFWDQAGAPITSDAPIHINFEGIRQS